MQLTCPTCDARYEVPEGMVARAGQHVQCTACHTRWFARPPSRAAVGLIGEDEIITRLESRVAKGRPTAAEAATQAAVQGGRDFVWEPRADAAGTDVDSRARGGSTAHLRLVEPGEADGSRSGNDLPGPAEAASEPSAPPNEVKAETTATAGAPASPSTSRAEAGPDARRAGGRRAGFLVGLFLVVLLVALYLAADAVAAAAPPLAPYVEAYVGLVDEVRLRAEGAVRALLRELERVLN